MQKILKSVGKYLSISDCLYIELRDLRTIFSGTDISLSIDLDSTGIVNNLICRFDYIKLLSPPTS